MKTLNQLILDYTKHLQKGAFEIWLSARNREILKKYKTILNGKTLEGISFFHDADNEDAIIQWKWM